MENARSLKKTLRKPILSQTKEGVQKTKPKNQRIDDGQQIKEPPNNNSDSRETHDKSKKTPNRSYYATNNINTRKTKR